MKIYNYLPELAIKFPNVYLVLNERLTVCIKSAYKDIKSLIGAKTFFEKVSLKKSSVNSIVNGDKSPSLHFIEVISKIVTWDIWNLVYEYAEFLRCKTNKIEIKIPKYLTEDLAYLLGALRDGSMTHYSNVYEIEISQKYKSWLEKSIEPRINRLFEVYMKIKLLQRSPNNAYAIRLRSLALFSIVKILSQYERHNFSTPRVIMEAPFDLQKYYVAGYYDAEGRKNKNDLNFFQNSLTKVGPNSLVDIKDILCSRKIGTKLKFNKQSNSNSYIFRLHVESGSRLKFLDLIPLEHPKITE